MQPIAIDSATSSYVYVPFKKRNRIKGADLKLTLLLEGSGAHLLRDPEKILEKHLPEAFGEKFRLERALFSEKNPNLYKIVGNISFEDLPGAPSEEDFELLPETLKILEVLSDTSIFEDEVNRLNALREQNANGYNFLYHEIDDLNSMSDLKRCLASLEELSEIPPNRVLLSLESSLRPLLSAAAEAKFWHSLKLDLQEEEKKGTSPLEGLQTVYNYYLEKLLLSSPSNSTCPLTNGVQLITDQTQKRALRDVQALLGKATVLLERL